MHTYRLAEANAQWEVIFDCGAQDYDPHVIKTFRHEADAVRLVSILNGSGIEVGPAVLDVLLSRGS